MKNSVKLSVFSFWLTCSMSWAGGNGQFLTHCFYDHSLPDDPIVHPGVPGAAHLHDFVGAKDTDAFSTYDSMRAGGTNCAIKDDTAGYWTPALYRNGVKINPSGKVRTKVYYNNSNLDPATKVEPFPADFRMIIGNHDAQSADENTFQGKKLLGSQIYWGCSDNSSPGKLAVPRSCSTGIISLHVGFPNCWDGVLTHKDDSSHLRYPSGGVCPVGFKHALPRVIVRWEFSVGTTLGEIQLSTEEAMGSIYSIHGDFWNTWNQPKLEELVNNCLNKNISCGEVSDKHPNGSKMSP